MNHELGPGGHTRVRRLPEKARYDADTVFAILDDARFCHLSANVNGLAMALPTLHGRIGETLYLHGSKSNAIIKAALAAGQAQVTVTIFDGLRLARSNFHSSIAYRSVSVVGPVRLVEEITEKDAALTAIVEAVAVGRSAETRPMSETERNLTTVLALDITEAAAKVSAGFCDEDPGDEEFDAWAGVVPARLIFDEPIGAPDGKVGRGEIDLPPSVRRLTEPS
jgi:uncharacterized protein